MDKVDQTAPVAGVSLDISRPRDFGRGKPVEVLLDKYQIANREVRLDTCPQCGINRAGQPRLHKLHYVPPWVYLGLMAHIIVFAILYTVGQKKVNTYLPLCEECAGADKRGKRLRSLSIGAAIIGPLLVAVPSFSFLDGLGATVVTGISLVAGVVGSVMAHRRTRNDVLRVKKIDEHSVRLLASPTWFPTLQKEAPTILRAYAIGAPAPRNLV